MLPVDPIAILRVICGVWFLPHAIGKLRNSAAAAKTFDKAGFRPGRFFVFLTIALELLAGAGLTFNVYPRPAAMLAVLLLLGAGYAVIRISGFNWRWQKQGPEYLLFWAIACLLSVTH